MPYAIVQTKNGYGVKNTETGHMKSHDISHEKAMAQMRLLEGLKHHTIDKNDKTYRNVKR